jgi:Kef-type K+ transport system membrane component KefB
MGGGSYLSIVRIAFFFFAVWLGSYASKKAKVSTIVAEIAIGVVLGPRVLGLMPKEYAQCDYEVLMNCELLKDGQWHNLRGVDALAHMVEEEEEYCMKKEQIDDHGSVEECLLAKCNAHQLHECAATPDIFTVIGHMGVSMMIFEAGMHVDFAKVKKVGIKACIVAVFGTFAPIILGTILIGLFGYGYYPNGLAVGISLSPTSIGIALKLLGEVGMLNRLFGQSIIVAAVVDDILALIAFQLFFSIAAPASGSLATSLIKLSIGVVAMCICAALAYKAWPPLMERILKSMHAEGKFSQRDQVHFFIMFVVLLGYATCFNFIGSHLWGCFVGGLSFTAVPHSHHLWVAQTKRSVKWMIRIFFACTVGFSIPVEKLFSVEAFLYGLVIGAIPCLAAKVFCGPFMGDARWVIGWGMCGRAEFAYYIAAGALASQLMDKNVYAITIWSLMCATIFAPFAFRFVLSRYIKKLAVDNDNSTTQPQSVNPSPENVQEERKGSKESKTSKGSTPSTSDKMKRMMTSSIGQSSEPNTDNPSDYADLLKNYEEVLSKNEELMHTLSELQSQVRAEVNTSGGQQDAKLSTISI